MLQISLRNSEVYFKVQFPALNTFKRYLLKIKNFFFTDSYILKIIS